MASTIPVEIVSEEEMAFLEAALASARPLLSSSLTSIAASPSRSALISAAFSPSRLRLSSLRSPSPPPPRQTQAQPKDIEDFSGEVVPSRSRSLLERFRARRALTVTDITAAEWCEKQMEFVLFRGKPKKTAAMEAGSNRHAELEKEVLERVEIRTEFVEESWAVKLSNFILGAHQLLFEGLTRELPVIGIWGNTWIVGVIDEVRMPLNEASLNPILVDMKTRYRATLPSEAQKRNARLQLMCYKYLWDGLVAGNFPSEYFFKHFELNPLYNLSDDVKQYTSSLGLNAETFGDVVSYFKDACLFLSPSHHQLILRYELQSDCSLLEEYQFAYDDIWLRSQIEEGLGFWSGEREASYVAENEAWKCNFCKFNTVCPMPTNSSVKSGQQGRICSS